MTTTEDLKNISASIQSDLDRFQRQKIHDLRDMLINYAKNHVEWCQKVRFAWCIVVLTCIVNQII